MIALASEYSESSVPTSQLPAFDRHTYERAEIEAWIRRGSADAAHPRSPMTNEPLTSTMLIPNITLRSAICEWRERGRK